MVLRNIFYEIQRYQMIPLSAQKAENQLQQASKLRNNFSDKLCGDETSLNAFLKASEDMQSGPKFDKFG